MNNQIRNTKFEIIIIILIALATLTSTSFAKEAVDISSASVGARAMGMGGAFVGVADDANSIFLNPAGLGSIKNWGITSMSTNLLGTVDYKMAGAVFHSGSGTFGIGYLSASTPAGYLTTDKGSISDAAPITYGNSVIFLSYGINLNEVIDTDGLGNLSLGASLKLMNQNFEGIDGASGTGLNADVGGVIRVNKWASVGCSVRNIVSEDSVAWESGTKEADASIAKLGGSVKLLGKEGLYKLWDNELTLNVDSDIYMTDEKPVAMHAGIEWKPMSFVTIRAGLTQDVIGTEDNKVDISSDITAGVGLNLAGFSFDYAYRANSNVLDLQTHYFSISYSPEIKPAKDKKVAELSD
ncbi:MAG: hypothetical protein NT030_05920 [Candidatus Saganbacteria bacterium]|nr:hypothetical protein [Candidatus Saganbacteria bacterium]